MNIVSYKDYKEYKPKLYQGMSKDQCALFNAVIMKYLLEKYFKYYGEDLFSDEKKIINDLVSKIWSTRYLELNEREKTSDLIGHLDKIGMDDEGEPRDLCAETIDILSSIDYAASENNGGYETTIAYVIEILTDGIDRELDEKYPEYFETSLTQMFTYKEMQGIINIIKESIELIKDNAPPEQVLNKFYEKV